jgi:hypothetical protein
MEARTMHNPSAAAPWAGLLLAASAALPIGCVNGVQYQWVSPAAPAASAEAPVVEPSAIPPGKPWRLRIRFQRPTYLYVIARQPDGSMRPLVPVEAVHNGSEFFEKGEVIELPAEGPGTSPAAVTMVVSEVQIHPLAKRLKGGIDDPAAVRRLLADLQAINPDRKTVTEPREGGWTEVFIKQFGVDDVVIERFEVGGPLPDPEPAEPTPSGPKPTEPKPTEPAAPKPA